VETLLASVVLILTLGLLWSGRRRLEFSSFVATLLSVVELAGFILSAVALRWVGVAIVTGVSVVAALAWSLVLAAQKQAILVDASVQSTDLSVEEANELWSWMAHERSFAGLRPLKRAELIRELAARGRTAREIRAMAVPIAGLATVFGCDANWLAPRFDQVLRFFGHEAAEAADVADILTTGTQQSAASFEDMVEALVTFASGPSPEEMERDEVDGSSAEGERFLDNVRAVAEMQVHLEGEGGVRLNGGPMDGWLVQRDAPSLDPDWHRTWPRSVAREHQPGRYELAASGTWAEWAPLRAPAADAA
jgi:hypothetical protein